MRSTDFRHIKPFIVVLDGMPGSGKTNHISNFKLHFGNLIKFFPESHHPKSISDEMTSVWYIKEERRKAQVSKRDGGVYILDRGYVSVVAFMKSTDQKKIIDRVFIKKYLYKPDITYFFDISPTLSLKRRKHFKDRKMFALWFDYKFLTKFRKNFRKTIRLYGKKIVIIGNEKFEKVQSDIEKTVIKILKKNQLCLDVSVVICTRNRAGSLEKLLKSLNNLKYPPNKFEVLVIDNGSKDNTRDIVCNFKTKGWNIRYYFENKLGLSNARNLGIDKSFGKIIAFLDDDTTVTPLWLYEINQFFEDKSVSGMGGRVDLVYLKRKPNWISAGLELYLSKLNYPSNKFKIIVPQYIVGANMAFRKDVFKKVGYFLPTLGRMGNKLLSGEELEFCLRVMNKNMSIFFNSDVVVNHFITEDRLNRWFFIKRAWWQGVTEKRLSYLYERPRFDETNWLKLSIFEILCILINRIGFKFGNYHV